MTNKARVEKLLRHLEYSEEEIQTILGKFKERKSKEKNNENNEDSDSEKEFGEERRGEAELLNDLLNKVSGPLNDTDLGLKKKPAGEPLNEGKQVWEPLEARPELEPTHVPPGCMLHVRMPKNASPNVQGTLPEGETFRNRMSHTKSFSVESASSSSHISTSGWKPRANVSQAEATAQVVSWLWDWWESNPERAAKKRRT